MESNATNEMSNYFAVKLHIWNDLYNFYENSLHVSHLIVTIKVKKMKANNVGICIDVKKYFICCTNKCRNSRTKCSAEMWKFIKWTFLDLKILFSRASCFKNCKYLVWHVEFHRISFEILLQFYIFQTISTN